MQENVEVTQPKRRRPCAGFKIEVAKAVQQRGASIAAVALYDRLNANPVARWMSVCGVLIVFLVWH
jgi:hypothetical protein